MTRFSLLLRNFQERLPVNLLLRFLRNAVWVFSGQVITSLSAFLVLIVLSNNLEKAVYGEYRFVLSVIFILSLSTLPGLTTAVVQATAQKQTGLLTALPRSCMRWGLWGSAAGLALASYYWWQGNQTLSISFTIVALCMPFYNTFLLFYFYLQGKELFNQAAGLQACGRVAFLFAMVGSVYLFPSTSFLIATYLAVTLLSQYLGYRWTIRRHPETPSDVSETLSYGKHLSAYQIPNFLAAQIGIISIWYWLGSVEAAVYAIALMIPLEANRLGSILRQVALPRLSVQSVRFTTLIKYILLLEIALFGAWIAYVLVSPYLFSVLLPTYSEALIPSMAAMLLVLLVPRYILRSLIHAKKMTSVIRTISFFTPGIHILLTLTLVPLYGLWGGIVALLLSDLLDYLVLCYLIRKYYRSEKRLSL